MTQSGSANLTLAGANTYGGTTTINSGTLTLTGSTSGLTGNLVDVTNLSFAQRAASVFNGTISGAGNVRQNGSANLTLAGANTYGGLTTINSGTLTLTGDTSGLTGNITDSSYLVFAQSANSVFNGTISGAAGNVTQNGSANLTLAGGEHLRRPDDGQQRHADPDGRHVRFDGQHRGQ